MPWLEDACERKNKAYHEKITNPSPENTSKYNNLKAFTDKHVNLAKKNCYSDYFEKHQTDYKQQWKLINSLLNRNIKHTKISKIRDCEGNVATSPQAIADKFNDYFANIAGKLKSEIPKNVGDTGQFLSPGIENYIYIKPTYSAEVSQIINDLKVKATTDINVATIKQANNSSPKFSQVIADSVNVSPKHMKTAKVVPIHKGGSKLDIQNYRPISLLSAFSKIYEKVMYGRIYDFLSKNNVLFENQFGFRKGRSCEHVLLTAQN